MSVQGAQGFVEDPRNDALLVYVNGDLVPKAEAKVSVFDSGFVLGDGVWDAFRLVDGTLVMVDPAPLAFPPDLKGGIEGLVSAIEAGNQEPRRQFIAERLFLPTSDRKLVDDVLKVMMAAPALLVQT